MVRVNGNFESNRNYFVKNEREVKQEIVKEIAVNENKQQKFADKSDELLNSTRVANDALMFFKNEKLDKEVASDLTQLYEMAGIAHRALPTATEYARIAGATKADITKFNEFETEKNIEVLFSNSALMDALQEESMA